MTMERRFGSRWLIGAAGALCLGSALLTPLLAQSGGDEVTPAVQRLYGEAKAAEAAGDAAAAIDKYRAILRAAPHLGAAYNNLGMLYFNQHDYAQAVPVLERGLKQNPNMPTAATMLGLSYAELGQYREAEPLLERAARANPSDQNIELSLFHTLMGLGREQEATGSLRAYLTRNPKDQQAWYALGETYLQMSEDALGKINQIDPNSYVAHEIAGEIDQSMHNYDGALVEFRKAVDEAPQQAGTHLRLGNAYWVMGKWESAETEFRAELAIDPNNCVAEWKLANSMLSAGGSSDEALRSLDQAIGRCPKLMQARVDRARALISLNRPSDALADLLPAEKDSPDEPSIHFLLAKVYKAEGHQEEATQELHLFAELQRKSSEAVAQRANEALTLRNGAH